MASTTIVLSRSCCYHVQYVYSYMYMRVPKYILNDRIEIFSYEFHKKLCLWQINYPKRTREDRNEYK